MNKNILVLNMGMKSIRSIIFDQFGNKLASAASPLTTRLNDERVLQDPEEWWSCAKRVICQTRREVQNENIDYITVTASSSCLVYVNEEGNPLDSCIMVSDKRAEKQRKYVEEMNARGMFGAIGVGNSASAMLAKILWVKENQQENYINTRYFLSPNDYLISKLTGKHVTDIFNALKFGYDVEQRSYPNNALRALGIDATLLPEVKDIGTCLGPIRGDVAKALQLPVSVKVVLTSYDAICSFFGSGVSQEGEASDVSGTVTAFRALTYKSDLAISPNIFAIPYKKKNCHIIGGSNNLGGGLIEWLKQCYYCSEEMSYEIMEKDAREAVLGAGGLLFLPYLLGERAPIWDSTVRGMFFGLERFHTRKEMTRAVFESAGFIDMDFVNEIEKTGMSIENIRVSGGLSRIHLVNQIKADVTGKNILVTSEFETTAVGAAMLALEAEGCFTDIQEAASVFLDVRMIIKPDYKNHVKYQRVYRMFKRIYSETRELFEERQRMCDELYNDRECLIENM